MWQLFSGSSFPPAKKLSLKLPIYYIPALPFFCVSILYKSNLKSHIVFSLARRPWFYQPENTGRKGEVIWALLVNIGRIPKAIFIVKDWETCESVLCQIFIDLILSWSSFSDIFANIERGSSVLMYPDLHYYFFQMGNWSDLNIKGSHVSLSYVFLLSIPFHSSY